MKAYPYLALLALLLPAVPLQADLQSTVDELIPRLAAENVEDRYEPQMELQGIAANAARPGAEEERAALSQLLAGKATDTRIPHPARVWIVRQLEYIGGSESVAALSALIDGTDAELKECARRALEKNSSSEATSALRSALQNHDKNPAWTIGLMHSLGQRRDQKSVELITPHLQTSELAPHAANALALIASPPAIEALSQAATSGDAPFHGALLSAADQLRREGKTRQARQIYRRLDSETNPDAVRAAALVGLVHAMPRQATRLISQGLQQEEPRIQQAAINAARELPAADLMPALAKLLPQLPPSAKVQLLAILDPSTEPSVIAAISDPDAAVRVTALETLGRIGSADSVQPLIQAVASDDRAQKSAAQSALATVSGDDVNAAIRSAAVTGTPAEREAAITAIANRNDTAALPSLVDYASDAQVSKAALAALRRMGTEAEFAALAKLLVNSGSPEALAALKAIAGRLENPAPAATTTLLLTSRAAPPAQVALLEVLSVLGGDKPLAYTTQLLSQDDAVLKDGAVRALGNWRDYPATRALLQIAADPKADATHNILAIRGIVRLVKSADDQPATARVALALATMETARRDDERKLVLSALGSIPHVDAAAAIKPLLGSDSLKNEAGLAGAELAARLLDVNRAVAKDLAQAVRDADLSRNINRQVERVLRQ